jgi:hypothetical protein
MTIKEQFQHALQNLPDGVQQGLDELCQRYPRGTPETFIRYAVELYGVVAGTDLGVAAVRRYLDAALDGTLTSGDWRSP